MSIQTDLKNTFLPEAADQIIKNYESLYYEDLKKDYEEFHFTGQMPAEFFSYLRNTDSIQHIVSLPEPNKDFVSSMIFLQYLKHKADEITEHEFYKSIKNHDTEVLERILNENDPDGIYKKLVAEAYK